MSLFSIIQISVTLYVFVAILIMVYKGLTMVPDNNYMDKVRHRALVWPLELIFITRRFILNKRLNWVIKANTTFKNQTDPLDFDITEAVFYVRDEDKSGLIHKEITKVENGANNA